MKRPRILLLHWGRNGGGPLITLELAEALTRYAEVYLSYSKHAELAERLRATGLPALPVATFAQPREAITRGYRLASHSHSLRQYVRVHEICAVVSTMEQVWQGMVAPSLYSLPVPYLMSIHDAEFHLGDASLGARITRALELAGADGVLTYSKQVCEDFIANYRYDPERVWRTSLGWPRDLGVRPRIRTLPPSGATITVGFFGRLLPYKGVALAAHAIAQLVPEFPGLRLEVWGSGSIEDLRPWANDPWLDLHNCWVAEEHVGTVLDRFDLLILPYREASQSAVVGLGGSLGIPCVSTPVGALKDQVEQDRIGHVATAPTAAALSQAVRRLITEPGLYQSCSERAVSARGRSSWDSTAQDVLAAAESLCQKGRRSPVEKWRELCRLVRVGS